MTAAPHDATLSLPSALLFAGVLIGLCMIAMALQDWPWLWLIRFGYWLRPYDWQRDARCWRWRRLACRYYVAGDS